MNEDEENFISWVIYNELPLAESGRNLFDDLESLPLNVFISVEKYGEMANKKGNSESPNNGNQMLDQNGRLRYLNVRINPDRMDSYDDFRDVLIEELFHAQDYVPIWNKPQKLQDYLINTIGAEQKLPYEERSFEIRAKSKKAKLLQELQKPVINK